VSRIKRLLFGDVKARQRDTSVSGRSCPHCSFEWGVCNVGGLRLDGCYCWVVFLMVVSTDKLPTDSTLSFNEAHTQQTAA
jgi:hypothetical protein